MIYLKCNLRKDLKRHEGLFLKPYVDSTGHLTIGYGTNITRGITQEEAEMLLDMRLNAAIQAAKQFSWWTEINSVRKDVVANMIYSLGIDGFKTFRKMITALEKKDYELASGEMLDSLWKQQVGYRALELAQLMREGRRPSI